MIRNKRVRKLTKVRERLRYTKKPYTLAVRVSNKNIYVLVLCSRTRNVLTQVSTLTPEFKNQHSAETANLETAKSLGEFAVKHIIAKGLNNGFAFDRGDKKYTGKLKALIESARAAGLSENETGE